MNSKKFGQVVVNDLPGQASAERDHLPQDGSGAVELSRELRSELLNPESWDKILENYARTMKLAVALTDPNGRLLGTCHNPQPVWRIAQKSKAEATGGCSFCLSPQKPCSAVVEALECGRAVTVRDQTGLAHIAVPLLLRGERIGALIAGQVFNRYPEPLPLRRVARDFGASAEELWQAAIHQVPVSATNLQIYGDLLVSLGEAFLRQCYGAILERRVEERTQELAQSNSDLLRANHSLEQFAYSASHDLQEPLRNVACYSQLFSRLYKGKLDGQADEFLGFITEGAKRMGLLVQDLLAYTRATTVSEHPAAVISATPVLEKTLASLDAAIRENQAVVTFDELPSVRVQEVHLEQLFQNLVGNAIKYRKLEQTPIIHIEAEQTPEFWLFSVRDNGIGIDPHYATQIFGIFKRLHTGDKYPGTGIGLALCQKIVERYRGNISVESELGKGSTFRFTLPA